MISESDIFTREDIENITWNKAIGIDMGTIHISCT